MNLPRDTAPTFGDLALELRRDNGFGNPCDSPDGRDHECPALGLRDEPSQGLSSRLTALWVSSRLSPKRHHKSYSPLLLHVPNGTGA